MYTIIADYIYDIYKTTRENNLPDLTLGLAQLRVEKEIPDGITDKELRVFIGRNRKALTRLFNTDDRALFVDVVEDMVEAKFAPKNAEDVSADV